MKKYYSKKRKKQKTKKIIILMSIFVVLSSAGYSLFSEVLSINGTAESRIYMIRDNKLRVQVAGPNYATGTLSTLELIDETYDGVNRLTSTFRVTDTSKTRRTEDIFIYVTNPYGYKMKSGSHSYTVNSGTFTRVVPKRQSVQILMDEQEYWRVRLKFKGTEVDNAKVTTKFTFTTDGVTQNFIWIIKLQY